MPLNSFGKNLLALCAGLLLVLLLEGVLVLCGVPPLADEDPFVGFAGTTPLFHEESPGQFVLNPAKDSYFNSPQRFAMPKPAGTFRIVVFGGSTTYGRPFLHTTSYGAWLEQLIERYADGADVEVINAGGISYASYRVRRLMTELSAYDPDLYVLYSGHNEFLEARTFAELRGESPALSRLRGRLHNSRLYSALARLLGRATRATSSRTVLGDDVEATLEQIGGPELYHRDRAFRQGVIRQYRHELTEMVRFCQHREIPLVLATLPVNLSGISPFKSEHAEALEPDVYQRWQEHYRAAAAALEAGDPAQALAELRRAEAIDAGYAQLHYLKGQAYAQLGESVKAYESFDSARQEDIVPLRALNEFNQALREIAASGKVPLADVETFYLNVSPGKIPGNNLFADHVHPTIEGQQLVAWVMLNAATRANLVPLDAATWQRVMPQAREYLRQQLEQISPRYRALGHWGVGRLYFWAGKYPEAYVALKQAWPVIQDQPELARQLGELELMRGDVEQALAYLDLAAGLAPEDAKVIQAQAAALVAAGRPREALAHLQANVFPQQDRDAGYHYTRGQALVADGQVSGAVDAFTRAVDLAPRVAAYRLALADALKQGKQPAAAFEVYEDYLELLVDRSAAVSAYQWLEQP